MFVRGDGTGLNWTQGIAMTHVAQNTWQVALPYSSSAFGKQCVPLASISAASLSSLLPFLTSRPSRLQFKTLVDDNTWSIGGNFFLTLPGFSSAVKVYPYFYSTSGMYRYIRNVTSPQLNNTRDLVIYTPPSYNENFLKCVHLCGVGVWCVWRVMCGVREV